MEHAICFCQPCEKQTMCAYAYFCTRSKSDRKRHCDCICIGSSRRCVCRMGSLCQHPWEGCTHIRIMLPSKGPCEKQKDLRLYFKLRNTPWHMILPRKQQCYFHYCNEITGSILVLLGHQSVVRHALSKWKLLSSSSPHRHV